MLLTAATLANRAELARLSPNCSLLAQPGGWACAKTVSQGNVFSVLLSSSAQKPIQFFRDYLNYLCYRALHVVIISHSAR
jgi:hypothetical protein